MPGQPGDKHGRNARRSPSPRLEVDLSAEAARRDQKGLRIRWWGAILYGFALNHRPPLKR